MILATFKWSRKEKDMCADRKQMSEILTSAKHREKLCQCSCTTILSTFLEVGHFSNERWERDLIMEETTFELSLEGGGWGRYRKRTLQTAKARHREKQTEAVE